MSPSLRLVAYSLGFHSRSQRANSCSQKRSSIARIDCFARLRNAGWRRVTSQSTHFGGVGRSRPPLTSAVNRLYIRPFTKPTSMVFSGAPARSKPFAHARRHRHFHEIAHRTRDRRLEMGCVEFPRTRPWRNPLRHCTPVLQTASSTLTEMPAVFERKADEFVDTMNDLLNELSGRNDHRGDLHNRGSKSRVGRYRR